MRTKVEYFDLGLESLKSRSPVFFADRVNKPLLIALGANDPPVNRTELGRQPAAIDQHYDCRRRRRRHQRHS